MKTAHSPRNNRVLTIVFPPALPAHCAAPYLVELLHRRLDDIRAVRKDTGLKIPPVVGLHAECRACQVRAAHINLPAVENNHLEMDPWAYQPLQPVIQDRVPVKILAESRSGLLRMYKPDLHALAYEHRQQLQERNRLASDLDISILDVGRPYPQSMLHVLAPGQDAGIMLGIGNKLYHHAASWSPQRYAIHPTSRNLRRILPVKFPSAPTLAPDGPYCASVPARARDAPLRIPVLHPEVVCRTASRRPLSDPVGPR